MKHKYHLKILIETVFIFYGFPKLICLITREAAKQTSMHKGCGSPPVREASNASVITGKRKAVKSTLMIGRDAKLHTAMLFIALLLAFSSSFSQAIQPSKIQRHHIDIPQLNAAEALNRLAEQTDVIMLFPYQDVKAHQANTVVGKYTLMDALDIMLEGSGLVSGLSENGSISISIEGADGQKNNHEERKMNIKTKKSLLATFVAVFGAGAGSSSVMAQDGNDAASGQRQLDEIIVTAQKREESAKDVSISITVLTGSELKKAGLTDIESISYRIPSLSVASLGSGGRQRISLRGVGNLFGNSSLVGLYLDDVPVSAVPFSEMDLRAFDMERLEVLKGPQGTLYGQGSVGGTIRFITNAPTLDSFGGSFGTSYSNTKGGDSSTAVSGVLNMPIVDDVFGLRIAAQYENTGGWVDRPDVGLSDINNSELKNIRIKSLWLPSENLSVEGMVVVHKNKGDGSGEAVDENHDQILTSFTDLLTPNIDEYDIYNLKLTYDLGSVSILSSSSYISMDKDTFVYQSGILSAFPDLGFEGVVDSSNDATIFTQEMRLQSNGDQAIKWTLGAFYRDLEDNRENSATVALGGAVFPPSLFFTARESKSWAVFGDVNYTLSDRLELDLGVRYFEDDRSAAQDILVQSNTFDATTWRTALSYDLNDDVSVYASIATGFRSGGFNVATATEPYGPEDVISYELGAKMNSFNGSLYMDMAFFYSKYTDMQARGVLLVDNVPLGVESNIGEAEIKGIDWSLNLIATENLLLGINANVINAEISDVSGVDESPFQPGDKVDLIPKYSYSLFTEYTFTAIKNRPGSLRVSYSEQGKSFLTNATFGLTESKGASDVLGFLSVKGQLDLDETWTLSIFGKNLLDENGKASASTSNVHTRPRPRTFGVSIGAQF